MKTTESVYLRRMSVVLLLGIGALSSCEGPASLPSACEANINSVFPLFEPEDIKVKDGLVSKSEWADFYVRLTHHHRHQPTDFMDTAKVRNAGEAVWDTRSINEAYSGAFTVKDLEETRTDYFEETFVEYEFACISSSGDCTCYFVPEK